MRALRACKQNVRETDLKCFFSVFKRNCFASGDALVLPNKNLKIRQF